MTPTPCRVARRILYLLGLRIYAQVHLLTYLLTYTVGSGSITPATKTVEGRAKVTVNGLHVYKVVHGLSIAAKTYLHLNKIQGY